MPETTTAIPSLTGHSLIAEAERLAPFLRQQADAIEDARRLTPEVHAAFLEAGLYRLTMPVEFGGPSATLTEVMRVLEILASGDASAAWTLWAALGVPVMAAFLDENGARELFSPSDACIVGSVAQMGRAVAVPGGYRVSGRWPFASGIHHATHASGICCVFDGETQRLEPSGEPVVLIPIWPVADCTVIDTWQTTGLRGTGSDDIEVRDLFVPERFVIDFARPPRSGLTPLHYIPVDNAANVTVAAMALGIAGSALAAFRELGPVKKQADGVSLADSPLGAIALGTAELRFAQARGHLYETVELMWEAIGDGTGPGEAWLPRTSLASVAAVDAAIEVVTTLYRAAGASAIFRSRPFDRCLRDLFTLAAHKTVQRSNLLQHGGATFARTG